MRIGVCGGTFDPVHYGHLIAGAETADVLGLERVIYIPAKRPPHKTNAVITDALHRMNMLRIALGNNSQFDTNDMEIKRSGLSYTVQTMEKLKKENPPKEFYFIMGQDAFLELETWYRYQELFSWCRVVVVTRPDSEKIEKKRFSSILQELINTRSVWCGFYDLSLVRLSENWRICFLQIPGMHISGSDIRTRVKSGRSIRYLVPEGVWDYIHKHELYQG